MMRFVKLRARWIAQFNAEDTSAARATSDVLSAPGATGKASQAEGLEAHLRDCADARAPGFLTGAPHVEGVLARERSTAEEDPQARRRQKPHVPPGPRDLALASESPDTAAAARNPTPPGKYTGVVGGRAKWTAKESRTLVVAAAENPRPSFYKGKTLFNVDFTRIHERFARGEYQELRRHLENVPVGLARCLGRRYKRMVRDGAAPAPQAPRRDV